MKIILKHRCFCALFVGFWYAKEHGMGCALYPVTARNAVVAKAFTERGGRQTLF